MNRRATQPRAVKDAATTKYHHERRVHWDRTATLADGWTSWSGRYYHRRIAQTYQTLIPRTTGNRKYRSPN